MSNEPKPKTFSDLCSAMEWQTLVSVNGWKGRIQSISVNPRDPDAWLVVIRDGDEPEITTSFSVVQQ